MSDKELMRIEYQTDNGQQIILSPGIVRKYLVSGGGNVTDGEIVFFLKMCQHRKMNPFLRECYLVKYGTSAAAIIAGKEYFTKKAEGIKTYKGFKAGIYVKTKEKIERRHGSCYFDGETLLGGWAEVYRSDREKTPIIAEVKLSEYIGYKQDGKPNRQWSRMPATMIRKVAIVQAHREAFPKDFEGLYEAAEISPSEITVDPNERDNLIMEIEEVLASNFFEGRQADILEKVDATRTIEALKAIKESLEKELSVAMKKENVKDAEFKKVNTSKFNATIQEAEAELEKAREEVGELFRGVNNE